MKYLSEIKVLTIILFIYGCTPAKTELDITEVSLDLEFNRIEVDLFQQTGSPITYDEVEKLKDHYGRFYKLFVENIISVGRAEDSATRYYLDHFKSDLQVKEIAQSCLKSFPDVEFLNVEMTNAFKRYKLLFPEKNIPQLYTFISAFSYTIVVDDEILGVGLDMYLGRNHAYYKRLGIPAYKVIHMEPENIAPDCMRSWLSTEFELSSENSDLISHMIYHGKIIYAMELLLPETPDSLLLGYTAGQMQWVNDNEKELWFHFANQNLFFDKDPKQINKYIGDAPFTPGFPEGSPGMTGRWVGWQIVKRYMTQNDPTDLTSLFGEKDAQKILSSSKYKPN